MAAKRHDAAAATFDQAKAALHSAATASELPILAGRFTHTEDYLLAERTSAEVAALHATLENFQATRGRLPAGHQTIDGILEPAVVECSVDDVTSAMPLRSMSLPCGG